ncbi:hypothetical protein [Paraburkholderia largidicola]|uniref:Uncharacterized protein n=1 Tax=Paraburkholderia largidicola TaxID=3014751 RepID=A0A7I8BJ35_9BURK|nr:hypothetical protein [Paraburkholderia sp. PGU16]BCF88696.1 hypothetical protein PPGU16_17630 [Paraburkholderia sp. PGU16]
MSPERALLGSVETFAGVRIIESPLCADVPRMTVNPDFARLMPAQFVAELNSWMRKRFGTTDVMVRIDDRTVAMSPIAVAELRSMVAASKFGGGVPV